ncbi:MAG: ATP dependent DNA ligase [Thermomicrobiales bacterium]
MPRDTPAVLVAFDLLYRDGDLLLPARSSNGAISSPTSCIEETYPYSAYTPGRRGVAQGQARARQPRCCGDGGRVGHGRRRHVLSDYTFAVRASEGDPTLLNIGKAYSGLTDAEITEVTQWFLAHTRQDFGRARTVEPAIILEVTFDVVQESKRHKSGYALRFPRSLRVRDDKPLDEIDTLDSVRALTEERVTSNE